MRQLMSNLLVSYELLSEEGKQNCSGEKCYESKESVSIKVRTVSSADSLALSEGAKSNSRKSYSYARVTTRRFSSAHVISVGDLQPSDLSGVNSSAVISTGGLSRPRINFLTTNGDIHREFGADLLNLIPTDRDLAKWISDCDSFIKDGHLGADKGEVKEVADQQRPTQGCNEAVDGLNKETLRREASSEKIDRNGEEVTTSCTVGLRITHTNSLSRKVVR